MLNIKRVVLTVFLATLSIASDADFVFRLASNAPSSFEPFTGKLDSIYTHSSISTADGLSANKSGSSWVSAYFDFAITPEHNYIEVTINNPSTSIIMIGVNSQRSAITNYVGNATGAGIYFHPDPTINAGVYANSHSQSAGIDAAPLQAGDVVMLNIDASGNLYSGRNGVWYSGGAARHSVGPGMWYFGISPFASNISFTVNVGGLPFKYSKLH